MKEERGGVEPLWRLLLALLVPRNLLACLAMTNVWWGSAWGDGTLHEGIKRHTCMLYSWLLSYQNVRMID